MFKILFYLLIFSAAKWLITKAVNHIDKNTEIPFHTHYTLLEGLAVGIMLQIVKPDIPFIINAIICVFMGNLASLAAMDKKYRMIYDVYHVISLIFVLALSFYFGIPDTVGNLMFFVLLQIFLFRHLYASGDVLLFCVCAAYLTVMQRELITYFIFMGTAILIQLIVQLAKKNVNKKGALKTPVGFAPYIVAAFCFYL